MNAFREIRRGEVICFASDNIKTKHGFSTRHGGVSTLPHLASMNFGTDRGDADGNPEKNYEIFKKTLGMDGCLVISAKQIHSNTVNVVTKADAGLDIMSCDGFVTAEKGIALAVKTADCVPILLYDENAKIIGAVHAGWRGAAAGIAAQAILKMIEVGAVPHNIQAAIGPSIGTCCYEVQDDFILSLTDILGKKAEKYIVVRDKKRFADVSGISVDFLRDMGVPDENISICGRCTCCEPELFFSHRATGGTRGTMAALISL